MPLLFAISLEQTAQITGLSVCWVTKQRNRFIQGKIVGDASVPARGGRRKQNFTLQEEAALLQPFLQQAKEGGVLVVSQVQLDLDLESTLCNTVAFFARYCALSSCIIRRTSVVYPSQG